MTDPRRVCHECAHHACHGEQHPCSLCAGTVEHPRWEQRTDDEIDPRDAVVSAARAACRASIISEPIPGTGVLLFCVPVEHGNALARAIAAVDEAGKDGGR